MNIAPHREASLGHSRAIFNLESCAYHYSDLSIISDVEIPFLRPTDGMGCDISFKQTLAEPAQIRLLEENCGKSDEPATWQCIEVGNDIYWLQLRYVGFLVEATGTHITVTACNHPRVSEPHVVRLFVDNVLPRILARMGRFVVHASCVAYGDQAILFLGDSGKGKSTLALAHCHLLGAELVSDDCVELRTDLNSVAAMPTYRTHRVWNDSRDAMRGDYDCAIVNEGKDYKLKIMPSVATTFRPYRVAAIFVMDGFGERIAMQELSHRAAVLGVLGQMFYFGEILPRSAVNAKFDRCEQICQMTRCSSLRFSRKYECLLSVAKATRDAGIAAS